MVSNMLSYLRSPPASVSYFDESIDSYLVWILKALDIRATVLNIIGPIIFIIYTVLRKVTLFSMLMIVKSSKPPYHNIENTQRLLSEEL